MVDPITTGIISWICGKLGNNVLKHLAGNDKLSQEIDKALAKWAKTLAEDRHLEPKALFPDIDASTAKEERSQYCTLQAKLIKKELPSKEILHAAFMEAWKWVRDNVEEPQPFFLLEESEAGTELERLAEVMHATCLQYEPVFKAAVIDKLDSMGTKIDELAPDDIQVVFEDAANLINNGEAKAAQVVLEGLWKRRNDKMTPRQKSNCKRLTGCSFDRQDKSEEAGRCFLEAKDYDPTWEKARAFESLGYVCLGRPDKAHQLVESVLVDFSQNSLAWSVWVRTAPRELSFAQVEKRVPEHLRQDAEVAICLAIRAATEGHYDIAERYVAETEKLVPGNPRVIEKLGDLMLVRGMAGEHLVYQRGPTSEEEEYLKKAEEFLSSALCRWQEEQSRSSIARVLLRRSCARQALRKHDQAQDDIRMAYETDRENPDVVFWYAVSLSERNLDEAIDLLRTILGKGEIPSTEHLLAQMLRTRGKNSDLAEAYNILKNRINDLAQGVADFRAEYIGLTIQIEREVGGIEQAKSTLDSIAEGILTSAVKEMLLAELLWLNGDSVGAVRKAKDAISATDEHAGLEERRRLANLLQAVGLHREALLIWKQIVRPDYIGRETYSLLECAQRCEDAQYIVEFSKSLGANRLWDKRIFKLELYYLELYNDYDGLEQVMRGFLREPLDTSYVPFIRLRLSILGIRTAQLDLVDADADKLPLIKEVEPRIGRMVATVLRYGKEPLKGIECAYDLLRLNRDNVDAHLGMIEALLPVGPKIVILEPEYASVGMAVQYQEDDTGTLHWHIIEDSSVSPPSVDHNEFAPGHYLSEAMHGKKCNETFALRKDSLQDRTATIKRTMSKYVYRFNDCLEQFETRFPDVSAIKRFVGIDKSGKLDTTPLDRLAKQSAESTQQLEGIYEEIVCPIFLIAQKKGRSLIETMNYVASKPGLKLKCCKGTDEEEELAERAIQNASAVVVDGSAVVTMLFTNTYERILELPIQVMITQGTLNELRAAEVLKGDSDTWAGSYSVDGFRSISQVEVLKARTSIEELIKFLEDKCVVMSGLVVAELKKERREQLIQLFGRAGVESMCIAAQERRVLWTDDLATGELSRTELGCQRVWTQFMFDHFAYAGAVSKEVATSLTVKLLQMEYHYTKPSVPVIMQAVTEANWDVDKAPLFQVLNWFGDSNVKLHGIFHIGAGVIKKAWQETVTEIASEVLTIRILERMSQRPGGHGVIEGLLANVDRIFGVDVVNAEKAKTTIIGWLKGTGGTRIILP